MDTLSIIDMILMFLGFANTAWIGILYVLSQSLVGETRVSKKVGTTNEKINERLEKRKLISNKLLKN